MPNCALFKQPHFVSLMVPLFAARKHANRALTHQQTPLITFRITCSVSRVASKTETPRAPWNKKRLTDASPRTTTTTTGTLHNDRGRGLPTGIVCGNTCHAFDLACVEHCVLDGLACQQPATENNQNQSTDRSRRCNELCSRGPAGEGWHCEIRSCIADDALPQNFGFYTDNEECKAYFFAEIDTVVCV
uniref:DB domain-containing protein n=1 Tax=Panagrellus redivivus TaxID=6233 RepID=A0A7E4VRY5_PANRE